MKIYRKIFGEKLKEARVKVGLTQAQLADILNIETPNISRWETGADFPKDARFPAICKALKVPESYFSISTQSQIEISLREAEIVLRKLNESGPKKRSVILYLITLDEKYLEFLKPQERQAAAAMLKIS